MATSDMDRLVERVRDALMSGELSAEDLTARRLCALVGKTTGALYHRFGSLDGLLHAVAQSGYVVLGCRVLEAFERTGDLADAAEAFVTFGLEQPALYGLMFERRYDWAGLRNAGAFEGEIPGTVLLQGVSEQLRAGGSVDPVADTRLLFAGMHGLVSLAASGRANVGALERTDLEVAVESARQLARRLCPWAGATTISPSRAPSKATSRPSLDPAAKPPTKSTGKPPIKPPTKPTGKPTRSRSKRAR